MRTFIAIELNETIKEELGAIQAELQKACADVKWVAPENIHLTLKFLGETDEKRLPDIGSALKKAVEGSAPFLLRPSGIGAFLDLQYPRIIWAGIDKGADEAARLNAAIESSFEMIGFEREKRDFHAHITIGRVVCGKHPRRLKTSIENIKYRPEIPLKVNKIALFQSRLTQAGAAYSHLLDQPLP